MSKYPFVNKIDWFSMRKHQWTQLMDYRALVFCSLFSVLYIRWNPIGNQEQLPLRMNKYICWKILLYYDVIVIVFLLQYHDIIYYMINFVKRQSIWNCQNCGTCLQKIGNLQLEVTVKFYFSLKIFIILPAHIGFHVFVTITGLP